MTHPGMIDESAAELLQLPNRRSRGPLFVGLLCLFAFVLMEFLAINQWRGGRWYLADVGNIQYVMVNTWGGQFFQSPLDQGNYFAFHFTPILFVLMPLVWLSKYPIPLVTTYVLALALTPWPIYALARQRQLPAYVAVALGFWFLSNHFTGSLQLANHFESLYVLAALATMALMRHQNRWLFWLTAVFALSIKEDCAAWLLAYAAWEWVFHRQEPLVRHRAIRLGVLCLAWGVIAVGVIALTAQGEPESAAKYVDRMDGISLAADNMLVLLTLVATTGGLCLLNWRAALLLLVPLPVILGNFPFTRQLLYYYSYPFLPFLAFATIAGASALVQLLCRQNISPRVQTGVLAGFIVTIGAVQYPLPTRTDGYRRFPQPVTPRDDMRRQVAREQLADYTPLALQFNLWGVTPWNHGTVFLNERQLTDSHYVFLDLHGAHGLAQDEFLKVMTRLRTEVETGRRKQLFDRYDFIILSPVTEAATTPTGTAQATP